MSARMMMSVLLKVEAVPALVYDVARDQRILVDVAGVTKSDGGGGYVEVLASVEGSNPLSSEGAPEICERSPLN